jgi:hypothetical protein
MICKGTSFLQRCCENLHILKINAEALIFKIAWGTPPNLSLFNISLFFDLKLVQQPL